MDSTTKWRNSLNLWQDRAIVQPFLNDFYWSISNTWPETRRKCFITNLEWNVPQIIYLCDNPFNWLRLIRTAKAPTICGGSVCRNPIVQFYNEPYPSQKSEGMGRIAVPSRLFHFWFLICTQIASNDGWKKILPTNAVDRGIFRIINLLIKPPFGCTPLQSRLPQFIPSRKMHTNCPL